jgi:hypothetical protein
MYVFVSSRCSHVLMQHLAFFGIIDLLSVLPYFIELMLHQDTVCPISLMVIISMPSHHVTVNIVPILNIADVPPNTSV